MRDTLPSVPCSTPLPLIPKKLLFINIFPFIDIYLLFIDKY